MAREKEQISPVAIGLTVLLHLLLFYGASTRFGHHHRSKLDPVVTVSIPVLALPVAHPDAAPDINALLTPLQDLVQETETKSEADPERYYLPSELSQQVQVLQDDTRSLNIPIRQIVTMTLYINEAGTVDDIRMDDEGDLSPAEQQRLLRAFRGILFFPGMRGAKVVKSLYRVELEINRKLTIIR